MIKAKRNENYEKNIYYYFIYSLFINDFFLRGSKAY